MAGRSKVATRYGIVAANQPLAAQAGVRILERGGTAVDAAIAANAVLGVVDPEMNGIGGDLFAIVYEAATDSLHGLNASGWTPAGLSAAALKARGIHEMPQHGIFSVTVPGAATQRAGRREPGEWDRVRRPDRARRDPPGRNGHAGGHRAGRRRRLVGAA